MRTDITTDGWITFYCPACKCGHGVPMPRWHWNGDRERPTITPSMDITSGHYSPGSGEKCWCTYATEHPNEPAPFHCYRCHIVVTDGKLHYQPDCSHALRGQTIEMEDMDS